MKILVTGANGFIGKNLIGGLQNNKNNEYTHIYPYDTASPPEALEQFTADCDFVFHLAGVNRPLSQAEFYDGNADFTLRLLNLLKSHNNNCPVMLSSSIQAALDNAYGRSKKAAEDFVFDYAKETGANVYVYRFPNVFGKWCRPHYNSAVATFCHNIANGLPITVNDPNTVLSLVYIDDVVNECIAALEKKENRHGYFCSVRPVYEVKLGRIVELLYSFRQTRENLSLPNVNDAFEKALYSTYISYLPPSAFAYPLKMNIDKRGSFTEIIKTAGNGQFSVNVSKPGIVKGNHWHNTKCEKFLVVSGNGCIQFRKIGSDELIEYHVSGEKLEVLDIPVGYTHNIINEGDSDLVTFMWANEVFNPNAPDTFYEEA